MTTAAETTIIDMTIAELEIAFTTGQASREKFNVALRKLPRRVTLKTIAKIARASGVLSSEYLARVFCGPVSVTRLAVHLAQY